MKNSNARKIMTLAMVLAMSLGTTGCGMVSSYDDSDSSKPAVVESKEKAAESEEEAESTEDADANDSTSAEDNDSEQEPSDISESDTFTAQKLFAMTVSEAVGMGTDSRQTAPRGMQAAPEWGELYGCTALPGYAFASTNGYDGTIDCINVLSGGYVNDNIYVGMTYNELCDALGEDIGIEWTNDDLYFSSVVTIDGMTWHIGFDLTDEQAEEIHSRLFAEEGVMPDKAVSISDIDPVSTVAVHYPILDN